MASRSDLVAARAKAKARADRAHDRYVVRTYGLAEGEYDKILAEQDWRCAMCRRIPRKRRLAVDHDHKTGKVRGLLCFSCNYIVLALVEFDAMAAYHASIYIGLVAEDLMAQQIKTLEPAPIEHDDGLPF